MRTRGGKEVSNRDLWERMQQLIERRQATTQWIKVPSHTGIPGNEEADRLAEEGVKSHGVPLKAERAKKAGVKRKEMQQEGVEAKRARRGAGEQHQRTGWFLVTETDIRQQRLKLKNTNNSRM